MRKKQQGQSNERKTWREEQLMIKLGKPSIWRASEASETLSGVNNYNRRYIYI